MKHLFALVLFVTATQAFAADRLMIDPSNKIVDKGVVTVAIPWLKDKGDKYDINLSIHNENDEKGMIIFLSDLGCKRGGVAGQLKHTFFNTGERTIDFRPGQTKEMTLVCKTEGSKSGAFELTVAKVYANPTLDGKTVGKILARNLNWQFPKAAAAHAEAKTETKETPKTKETKTEEKTEETTDQL